MVQGHPENRNVIEENIENFRWLVSPDARPWLDMITASERSLVALSQSLRKEIGVTRTHMVVALVELRRRAKKKFSQAERMFFTRQLLEQATDEAIANYKASRFPANQSIADLCCGIGGDLLGLAGRGGVTAVDRDPVAVLLAEANCQATGKSDAQFVVADASEHQVDAYAGWHLDPDRRSAGRRTTKVEYQDPEPGAVDKLRMSNPQAAIKLAPAAAAPVGWAEDSELEWIGSRGECRQQVAWFGDLTRKPGQRSATVLSAGSKPCTILGDPAVDPPLAPELGRYVFEPHAAVLAARLNGALANQHDLWVPSPRIAYLTGDDPVASPALSCFEVADVLPFDVKTVRAAVRERGIGNLEVKQRGLRISPEDVIAKIRAKGDDSATLILMRIDKKVRAVLTRRVKVKDSDLEEV